MQLRVVITIIETTSPSKVLAFATKPSHVPVRTLTEIAPTKKRNFPQVQSKGFSHAFT